jgi:hypothetical protein
MSNVYLVRPIDAAYSLQRIAHKAYFGFKLRFIVDVLELAPAAVAEVPARRFTSRRRGLQYAIDHRASERLLSLGNSNPEPLVGRGERNEDGESAVPSYSVAAISQPFSCHFDDVANVECLCHKLTIAGGRVRRKLRALA